MFRNCKTLEELKKSYHKLVLQHHPDRGGETAKMQEVNHQYDIWFPKLKNFHHNMKGEIYEKENAETPDAFKDIIDTLIKMEGLKIEIIGTFVWVTGDTKPHKDAIKAMGFKWHSKKLCWYLPPIGYKKRSRKNYSMDEIRDMYGSQGKYDAEEKVKITA